jgi:hypothetical protein
MAKRNEAATDTTVNAVSILDEGELVRVVNTSPVYLIMFGNAWFLPDVTTANNLFGPNWSNTVQEITPQQFASVPQAPPFTSGACIITPPGGGPLYVYTGGQKLYIWSPPAQTLYQFNGTPVVLPSAFINAIPNGLTIAPISEPPS